MRRTVFGLCCRPTLSRCGLVTTLLLVSACYTSRPITSSSPAQETRILGTLTGQTSSAMETVIGRDAVAVEGIVSETRDDGWDLRVLRVDQTGGRSVRWNKEVVTFPAGAFSSVVERRLQKTRSSLLAGGLTVGVIVLARVIGLAGIFDGGGGEDPPPPQ